MKTNSTDLLLAMARVEACLFEGLNKSDIGIDRDNINPLDLQTMINALKNMTPRPIDDIPATNSQGIPVRVVAYVPPYGFSMAHYDDGWSCHSILNKDAKPTHGFVVDGLIEPPHSDFI